MTRDDFIGEVDLALAALRRVILRGLDGVPTAIVAKSAAPKPVAVASPKSSVPREIPVSLQRVSAAGLDVEIAAGGGTITFQGISARVSRRQAQLVGVLAKASPSFMSRDDATARAWPDLAISSRATTVPEAMRCLADALAPLKVKVEAMPGYGLRLWAMEDGK
jgi:hypothetical protein